MSEEVKKTIKQVKLRNNDEINIQPTTNLTQKECHSIVDQHYQWYALIEYFRRDKRKDTPSCCRS